MDRGSMLLMGEVERCTNTWHGRRPCVRTNGGGKDFAKVRAKVEVVDEVGGTEEEEREGGGFGGAVRDESRGWKRGDSGSQRVKAAPSGRSMCVASASMKFRRNVAQRMLSTTPLTHVLIASDSLRDYILLFGVTSDVLLR